MKWKVFCDHILGQIGVEAICDYGCIGTEHQFVLIVKDGKIHEIGEFIYRLFRDNLIQEEDLIQFGKECEKYRIGQRATRPSYCYGEDGLKIH